MGISTCNIETRSFQHPSRPGSLSIEVTEGGDVLGTGDARDSAGRDVEVRGRGAGPGRPKPGHTASQGPKGMRTQAS